MGFGIDWDGDGKVSDNDEMMTVAMIDSDEEERRTGSQRGCCGTCLMIVLIVPVFVLGVSLKIKGII